MFSGIDPTNGVTCKTLPRGDSGAEGSRTPDLRRAKSKAYYHGYSPLFKITYKIECLPLEAFATVRHCLCGLVYYWCK